MTDWTNQISEENKEKMEKVSKGEPLVEFKSLKEAEKKRGMKILSYGNFGTGKTHFALDSTKPVYVIDTENGTSPLANKFPDAKVINISNMDKENVEEKDEVKNFDKYMEVVDHLCSLPDDEVGTIVVDSISDIWEWAQAYAKVKVFKIGIEDRLKQQWDWGIINKLYLKTLKKLINKNCNLILTARESEVYLGAGQPSGRYQPKCQKTTPYWADVVLYHKIKFINKQISFQAMIEKCRHNGKIIGATITNPTTEKIKQIIEQQ